jgi:hypothetical protein
MFKRIYILTVASIVLLCALSAQVSAGIVASWSPIYFGTTFDPMSLNTPQPEANERVSHKAEVIGISANLALLPLSYEHLVGTWGRPNGNFHIKSDWSGDYLGLNDEVSHLFVSYKLMQFFHGAYKHIGFSEKSARILGVVEAAFIVTAVEYPLDAYNPDQGFGISDLVFDYTGIFMSYLKISHPCFRNWDLKASVKSISHSRRQILGNNVDDYDNYIYWLTYRKSVAVFGLGYSTSHPVPTSPVKEFYFGIGTTIPDLLRPISHKLAGMLEWAGGYYFNLRWNFLKFN